MQDNTYSNRYDAARQRVSDLRKFYGNLTSYVIVIGGLAILNYATNHWAHMWFLWAAFGWGIGLATHAARTFVPDRFSGRDWEARKINEYMADPDAGPLERESPRAHGSEKYRNAKKRVGQLKGFYIHALVYLMVNTFILLAIYQGVGRDSGEFWQWETFATAFFWGVGLMIHALNVFAFQPLFGSDWEARQVKKYMDRDRRENERHH